MLERGPVHPAPNRWRILVLGGKIILTVLMVAYVFHHVDWRTLVALVGSASSAGLIWAVGLQACVLSLATTRWRMLLSSHGIPLPWPQVARLSLIGLFFNLFSLGSIGGDAAKFTSTLRYARDQKGRLVLSLLQDRIIGLGALLTVCAALIALSGPGSQIDSTLRDLETGVSMACLVFLLALLVLWVLSSSLAAYRHKDGNHWLNRVREVLPHSAFPSAFSLSLVIHLLSILVGYMVARSFGIKISFLDAGIVLTLTTLVLSLPVTVAGLGVRDGALLWLLPKFGVSSVEQAVALSSGLLGISLFWSLAGGLAFYWPVNESGKAK